MFFSTVLIIIILTGLLVWNNTKDDPSEDQHFTHVTINGTILAYRAPDEGLYFIIDDNATTSYKQVIVIESTLFTDDLLQESVFNKEEGLSVTVEVDTWTDDLYTAALISPTTD